MRPIVRGRAAGARPERAGTLRRKMRRGSGPLITVVVVLTMVGVATTGRATAARVGGVPALELTLVAQPADGTAIAARPGSPDVYIAEQAGRVRVLRGGKLVAKPALDISADVTPDLGEQGLLGLAFSPDGSRIYLDFTDRAGDTQVVEYSMRGRTIDATSRRKVLTVDQPQANHNGGQLAFGPDDMLYVALGDGGAAGDQGPGHVEGGNSQSLATLLGKILRIDPLPNGTSSYTVPPDNPFVGRPGARPEIWAYGLRNPWRFTFDRPTGDLWIGDVGQDSWEEIDRAPAIDGRDAGRGDNFGWNRLEGTHQFTGPLPGAAVPPVSEYSHADGSCSVTGGYVYRGRAIPALQGMYLFTDYCDGELRALQGRADGSYRVVDLGLRSDSVSTFGEQRNGEILVLSRTNGLSRLAAA